MTNDFPISYNSVKNVNNVKMIHKTHISTGEIARMLHVSRITVYQWIVSGKLKAFRVPRGKYRVLKNDFEKFIEHSGLKNFINATSGEHLKSTIKILVADKNSRTGETFKTELENRNHHFHVVVAANSFEAGYLVHSFRPGMLIINLDMFGGAGFNFCQKIKSTPGFEKIGIIGLTGRSAGKNSKRFKKKNPVKLFAENLNSPELLSGIEKLTGNL